MGMFLVSKAFGRDSKLWKKELRNDDARGKQNKKKSKDHQSCCDLSFGERECLK